MEQPTRNFTDTSFQLRARPTESGSSMQSSSSDEQSSGPRAPPRRRSLPNSKNTKAPPARINTSSTGTRSMQTMSAGPRSGSNNGTIMQMTGTISPSNEITYTPTTHRISKAKKGKKVHACEYPGCTKIFTRAEHRKRHEANHNAVPLFQCDIEGCRKPFQRADLLTRHMERQHNMPIASPPPHNHTQQEARRSTSETSTAHSNPTTPSIIHPSLPQHHQSLSLSQPVPISQPMRAMSINSLVEPSLQRHDYPPPHHTTYPTFTSASHLPVPPTPRNNIPPDQLLYGLPPTSSESPYCSSSDSCYSPMSDLIQPQLATQTYLPQDDNHHHPRAHSASSLECGFPQTAVYTSPSMSAAWNYDHAPLSGGLQGLQGLGMTSTRDYEYPSPTFMSQEVMGVGAQGLPYELGLQMEWGGLFRKVTY